MPPRSHTHRYLAGTDSSAHPLVLLHGSDGTESDLLPLAGEVAPGAPRLALRGAVATDGGYAFFRRLPDRRVDEVDLAGRLLPVAQVIETSCAAHHFTRQPVALGFSNGAIMAAALLMTSPALFAGAILLRPLSPFSQDLPHRLDDIPVLIVDGSDDTRRSPGDGLRLTERLRRAGASVTHHVLRTGHLITAEDAALARDWLRAHRRRSGSAAGRIRGYFG
ncbi:alpha/beta hydrolase [Nocardia asteroides]|uniref:alpha/beta hydrolase n=1 Tax=Nocardia asteroides TaxID=1824 RepID=UPI0033E4CC4F